MHLAALGHRLMSAFILWRRPPIAPSARAGRTLAIVTLVGVLRIPGATCCSCWGIESGYTRRFVNDAAAALYPLLLRVWDPSVPARAPRAVSYVGVALRWRGCFPGVLKLASGGSTVLSRVLPSATFEGSCSVRDASHVKADEVRERTLTRCLINFPQIEHCS